MRTFRSEAVPLALQQLPNWVLWRDELVDGRPTKIPYRSSDGLHRASTQDHTNWVSFPDAVRQANDYKMGIGFVFTDTPFAGIDFDGCRDPATGKIDDWALSPIRALNSYAEISPSQTGVKVFVRGQLPGPGAKAVSDTTGYGGKHRSIELYDVGRYFTVTGNLLDGAPSTVEAADLTELYRKVKDAAHPPVRSAQAAPAEPIPSGLRHDFLKRYAGRLLNDGIGEEALETELLRINRERFSPPKDEREIRKQARDFYKRWKAHPSLLLMNTRVRTVEPDVQEARLSWFEEVEVQNVDWLWHPYVPFRALTVMSGDPGAGKSWIALWLAAKVTNEAGRVLYLSVENPVAEVLKPRFLALGGDPSKIRALQGVVNVDDPEKIVRQITLEDIEILEREIARTGYSLVVVDPIQSYLGGQVDMHRANQTRPILDGLIQLAERQNFALLVLRHCSKSSAGRVIYRGLGTIDISGAARSELLVGERDNQMVMAQMKNNLGMRGASRNFQISDYEIAVGENGGVRCACGRFEWGEDSPYSAEQLVEEPSKTNQKMEAAKQFLKERLQEGFCFVTKLIEDARGMGISERTLRRAKTDLGIEDTKHGMGGGWIWYLPDKK